MHRHALALALGLGCLVAPMPAAAQSWPDNIFGGSLTLALHVNGDGPDVSVGLRMIWTHLRSPIPIGADAEVRYVIDRGVFRFMPGVHFIPDEPISGNDCRRTQVVRRRVNEFGLGPVVAFGGGPMLEAGGGALKWGASAGGNFGTHMFGAQLRALWLEDHGLEGELGAGFRMPSSMGDSDILILCD